MSSNHAKDFPNREASARETARWLRPFLHRAINDGEEKISVFTKDLDEILAYMEAAEYKEKVEFSGHRAGFAEPDMIRDLISRRRASIPTLFKKTDRYCVELFYQELPKKTCKDDAS